MSTRSLFRVGQQFRPETSLARLANTLDDLGNPLSRNPIKSYDLQIFHEVVRLGDGSSFVVDRGRFLEKDLVAVKRTLFAETGRRERSDENGQYSFQDQLELLYVEVRALSHPPLATHPNIVKLLGYGWSVSQGMALPFVVVEYAVLGTLDAFLSHSDSLPLDDKLLLAYDVACGLDAIHACKVIHGDVKLANVLLYRNNHLAMPVAKLSDFGHAVLWSATRIYEPIYGGTLLYNAPEVFAQDFEPIAAETMHKCDVYSYGLLLWGVLKDGSPYFDDSWLESHEEDKIEFLQTVDKHWLVTQAVGFLDALIEIPRDVRLWLGTVLQRCLEYESARRPGIREVISLMENEHTREPHIIDTLPLNERILDEATHMDFGPADLIRTYPPWPAETRKELYTCYASEHSSTPHGFGLMRRAECHSLGFGVREDMDQVLRWTRLSANKGYLSARLCLDRLREACMVPIDRVELGGDDISSEVRNQIQLSEEVNKQLGKIDSDLYYSTRVRIVLQNVIRYALRHAKADQGIEAMYGPAGGYLIRSSSGFDQSLLAAEGSPKSTIDGLQDHSDRPKSKSDVDSINIALFRGDNASLELRLKSLPQEKLNGFDSNGLSPLLFACSQGNAAAVRMMLDAGAYGGEQDRQVQSPLHYLNQFEPEDMAGVARALVHSGADVNAQTAIPKVFEENHMIAWGTPLHWAVAANNITVVLELLSLGADPLLSSIEGVDSPHDHFLPLHLAAGLWLPEMTALLLSKAEYGHFPGYWPLHMMTRAPPLQKWMIHGNKWRDAASKTIQVLLEAGHKVDQLDHTGMTPLCCSVWLLASELCAGPVVRELLAQGADPNIVIHALDPIQQPLHHYAIEGLDSNEDNVGLVPILWEYGADFNTPDDRGTTPLMKACRHNEHTVVTFLLSKGIFVHARDQLGQTALHHVALTNTSESTVKALLAAGLRIDIPDGVGTTPLGKAISSNLLETADILLRNGASLYVNPSLEKSHTILHHALRYNRNPKRAIFHLLTPGSSARNRPDIQHVINEQYADGSTALHFAVMTMNYACARELVAAGADPQLVWYRVQPGGQSVVRLAEDCLFVDGFLPADDRSQRGRLRYRRLALKQVAFLRNLMGQDAAAPTVCAERQVPIRRKRSL